jgi:hypothetical protein
MWANLLSGGHATYGGLNTYEPFAGAENLQGVRGYLTAVREGRLDDGAADFPHIRRFFDEAKLTLVGLQPNDALAGNDGHAVKVIAGEKIVIAYLQNPDSRVPETANVAKSQALCRLHLPPGGWRIRWFDPRTGQWHADARHKEISGGDTRDFKSPFARRGAALDGSCPFCDGGRTDKRNGVKAQSHSGFAALPTAKR